MPSLTSVESDDYTEDDEQPSRESMQGEEVQKLLQDVQSELARNDAEREQQAAGSRPFSHQLCTTQCGRTKTCRCSTTE